MWQGDNMGSIIAEQDGGTEVEISAKGWGASAVTHFYRSTGSQASPGAMPSGSLIGGIGARPYVGSDFAAHSTAAIHWIASEDQTPNNNGAWLRFLTTPTGSPWSARQINMQISPSGYLYYKVGSAQVYKSNDNQFLSSGSYEAITFNAPEWDNRSMQHSSTKLIAQQDGVYEVDTTICFATNSNGARIVNFRVNGSSSDRYGYQSTNALSGLSTVISSNTSLKLSKGDYVEVYAYQNSGTSVAVRNETNQAGITRFGMRYVGDY